MPELAFSTWLGFMLARARDRVEEGAVWAQAGWRAHAFALVHVPYPIWTIRTTVQAVINLKAFLRQTCASADVIFPVLVFTARIWLRGATTLAEMGAPVEIDAV